MGANFWIWYQLDIFIISKHHQGLLVFYYFFITVVETKNDLLALVGAETI